MHLTAFNPTRQGESVMFCEHFKDTHAALNGALRCFDKSTAIETDNEVIAKKLAPLCT